MRITLLVLAVALSELSAQSQPVIIEDLHSRWMVTENEVWLPFSQKQKATQSVYFTLDARTYRGSKLEIGGRGAFSIWMNGQLIDRYESERAVWSMDSLAKIYSPVMSVGVHAPRVDRIVTQIRASAVAPVHSDVEELRKTTGVPDFTIMGCFILAVSFIVLLRFNPRLTMDYFNMIRLFSLAERDDSLVTGRITSRFSFLVYIFIGTWCSFLALIVFHHSSDLWSISSGFHIRGVADGFLKWGQLTVILFTILFAKVALVLILSAVFRLREGAAIQVLNYFRLLGFLLILLSVILVIYFSFSTIKATYYENLIGLTGWILGGWAILIFVKLLNKSSHSVFHLFSYLCASEFFPIIIFFKVLFF